MHVTTFVDSRRARLGGNSGSMNAELIFEPPRITFDFIRFFCVNGWLLSASPILKVLLPKSARGQIRRMSKFRRITNVKREPAPVWLRLGRVPLNICILCVFDRFWSPRHGRCYIIPPKLGMHVNACNNICWFKARAVGRKFRLYECRTNFWASANNFWFH